MDVVVWLSRLAELIRSGEDVTVGVVREALDVAVRVLVGQDSARIVVGPLLTSLSAPAAARARSRSLGDLGYSPERVVLVDGFVAQRVGYDGPEVLVRDRILLDSIAELAGEATATVVSVLFDDST